MTFVKGHKIWLGRKKTKEQIDKTRFALMKRVDLNCLVCKAPFQEIPSRIKMGKGKFCSKICSDKAKVGMPSKRLGKIYLENEKEQFRKAYKTRLEKYGKEGHPRYIKDRTLLKGDSMGKDRRTSKYRDWRLEVLNRDNHVCKIGTNCQGRLEVHHILSWREYPELRYVVSNGITLCSSHHPRGKIKETEMSFLFKELLLTNLN